MNKDALNEIRARCDAAEQAMWELGGGNCEMPCDVMCMDYPEGGDSCDGCEAWEWSADAGEIVQSLKDIPALLDYISELEAENAELRARVEKHNEAERITRPLEITGDAVESFLLAAELSECKQELEKYRSTGKAAVWCKDCRYYVCEKLCGGYVCTHRKSDWCAEYPDEYCSCKYCETALEAQKVED